MSGFAPPPAAPLKIEGMRAFHLVNAQNAIRVLIKNLAQGQDDKSRRAANRAYSALDMLSRIEEQ